MSATATSRVHSNGSFQITGADHPIEVPGGEYFFDTKARNERLMTSELSKGARQIHAALAPFTMYYRREVALRPDGTPATSHDLCKKTGYDKALVRRYLDELEEKGYGERRCTDDGRIRKGRVLIISWAKPRAPKEKKGTRASPKIGWIPDSWQSLQAYANRCRYKIPENLNLDEDARTLIFEEGEQIARVLEDAQERAARFWDRVCAQDSHNKEDRKTDIEEQKEAGRQTSTVEQSLAACPEPVSDNNGNATHEPSSAEKIMALPAVHQLEEQLHDVVSPDLAEKIAVNLRDAPLEALNDRILLKLKDTRSLARLPSIAADVANYDDIQKTRARNATQNHRQDMQAQEARTITDLKQNWRKLSETDRQLAKDAYPEVDWPPG